MANFDARDPLAAAAVAGLALEEQADRDYRPMSPYEFEEGAVQQEGRSTPHIKWLVTNYDTFVKNPFWDGTVTPDPWDEGETNGI